MEIHRAIKQGNRALVIQLMEEDPSRLHMNTPFGTWLQDAARHGQVEIAKWFIDQGLDVNALVIQLKIVQSNWRLPRGI